MPTSSKTRDLFTTAVINGKELHVGDLYLERIPHPQWTFPTARLRKPNIFLCHRGPDAKESIARPTKFFLDQALKVDVFFDDDESADTHEKNRRLLAAAYKCNVAVVIATKNFRKSEYCVKELNTFMSRYEKQTLSDLVIAPWDIEQDEWNRYAKKVHDVGRYSTRSGTDDPALYMVKELWPRLEQLVGKQKLTENERKRILAAYIQENSHRSDIPKPLVDFERRYGLWLKITENLRFDPLAGTVGMLIGLASWLAREQWQSSSTSPETPSSPPSRNRTTSTKTSPRNTPPTSPAWTKTSSFHTPGDTPRNVNRLQNKKRSNNAGSPPKIDDKTDWDSLEELIPTERHKPAVSCKVRDLRAALKKNPRKLAGGEVKISSVKPDVLLSYRNVEGKYDQLLDACSALNDDDNVWFDEVCQDYERNPSSRMWTSGLFAGTKQAQTRVVYAGAPEDELWARIATLVEEKAKIQLWGSFTPMVEKLEGNSEEEAILFREAILNEAETIVSNLDYAIKFTREEVEEYCINFFVAVLSSSHRSSARSWICAELACNENVSGAFSYVSFANAVKSAGGVLVMDRIMKHSRVAESGTYDLLVVSQRLSKGTLEILKSANSDTAKSLREVFLNYSLYHDTMLNLISLRDRAWKCRMENGDAKSTAIEMATRPNVRSMESSGPLQRLTLLATVCGGGPTEFVSTDKELRDSISEELCRRVRDPTNAPAIILLRHGVPDTGCGHIRYPNCHDDKLSSWLVKGLGPCNVVVPDENDFVEPLFPEEEFGAVNLVGRRFELKFKHAVSLSDSLAQAIMKTRQWGESPETESRFEAMRVRVKMGRTWPTQGVMSRLKRNGHASSNDADGVLPNFNLFDEIVNSRGEPIPQFARCDRAMGESARNFSMKANYKLRGKYIVAFSAPPEDEPDFHMSLKDVAGTRFHALHSDERENPTHRITIIGKSKERWHLVMDVLVPRYIGTIVGGFLESKGENTEFAPEAVDGRVASDISMRRLVDLGQRWRMSDFALSPSSTTHRATFKRTESHMVRRYTTRVLRPRTLRASPRGYAPLLVLAGTITEFGGRLAATKELRLNAADSLANSRK